MDAALSALLWLWLAFCLLLNAALCVVLFFAGLRLHQLRSHRVISPRHPSLVIATHVAAFVHIAAYRSLWAVFVVLSLLGHFGDVDPEKGGLRNKWLVTGRLAFLATVMPIGVLVLLRVWLVYFDTEHALALRTGRWAAVIDRSLLVVGGASWFVRAKETWGNDRFMLPVAIFGSLALAAGGLMAYMYNVMLGRALVALVLCGVIATVVYLRCKTEEFEDRIWLRQEMHFLIRFLAASAIGKLMFDLGTVFWAPLLLVSWPLLSVLIAAVAVLQSIYPLRLIYRGKKATLLSKLNVMALQSQSQECVTSSSASPSTTVQSPGGFRGLRTPQLPVDLVISDPHGFSTFMEHLFKEFSSENLIAVVELTMFQERNFPEDPGPVTLPEGVRDMTSTILKMTHNVSQQGKQLIEKYILNSAPHQVNIPHGMREHLTHLHHQCRRRMLRVEEWRGVFEPVIQELLNLMNDSNSRYRANTEYQRVISLTEAKSPRVPNQN